MTTHKSDCLSRTAGDAYLNAPCDCGAGQAKEAHAPGPWEWDHFSEGWELVGPPVSGSSVRQSMNIREVLENPDCAVGHLIAAAPETAAERDRLHKQRIKLTKIIEDRDEEVDALKTLNVVRKKTEATLTKRNESLVEALEAELANCGSCSGTGTAYTHSDETEVGQAPGSSGVDCPECRQTRAALSGEQGK